MRLHPRDLLRRMFDAAVASAQPSQVLAAHLPEKPKGRCIVVGAGKASAAMAAALEAAWPNVPLSGLVVTRYGHAMPTSRIEVMEAAHPVPDDNSLAAANRILRLVQGLSKDDLVIALISGGGSALLTAPADGLVLADKQRINAALLQSGAAIAEMNVVRRHLSRVKGGKLAQAAAPARVVTLVISDVPGDDPAVIASGPTVPDGSTPQDALAIMERHRIDVPDALCQVLAAATVPAPPAPAEVRMIASPLMALKAAASVAQTHGVAPVILGDALEGEAKEVGRAMAGMAVSCARHGQPAVSPCVLLSCGETTVSIGQSKPGRGGRNTEFLLAAAITLNGSKNVHGLAADTDGIDGTEDAAGAFISPETLSRARMMGWDARQFLETHDSYSLFNHLGDLIVTGPTHTNVNDFRAFLVVPA